MHFILVLLPVFLIFSIGFVGQKCFLFDIRSLSIMALYLMTPFLVFKAFYLQPISIDFAYYVLYCLAMIFILIAIVKCISFKQKYNAAEQSAMILGSVFMNSGNYGIPVVWLAFGENKAPLAVIISIIMQLLMNTVGFYYAARGSTVNTDTHTKDVLNQLVKLPVIYAAMAGVLLQWLDIELSAPLMRAVSMVGDASVVIVMIALGMQLATIKFYELDWPRISLSMFIKLILSPLVALGIVWWMPLALEEKKILILLAAMPTAAVATLLAVQFQTKPALVSSVTFFSTIASLLSLSTVLSLMRYV